MHLRGGFGLIFRAAPLVALLVAVVVAPARPASAQYQPPAQSLTINGNDASTWIADGTNVIQLEGPVTIDVDRTRLTARQAVVWLREVRDGQPGEQAVTVALIGDARITQPQTTRTGQQLVVNARVNGPIRITADNRNARDLSTSATFRLARSMRDEVERRRPPPSSPTVPTAPRDPRRAPATTQAAAPARIASPVSFRAEEIRSVTTDDGKLAVALSGGVALRRVDDRGDHLELQADRAVLFTTLARLRDAAKLPQNTTIEGAITGAYLEGDVRVVLTYADDQKAEQKMQANRVFYDFTTDRAVLTEAVLRTIDPVRQIPIIVRAQTVRQLSQGEYRATDADLSTSTFAVPSFSIRSDRIYVRQEEAGDEQIGTRTNFNARDVSFRAFDLPFFYLPSIGGSLTEQGLPIRALSIGASENYGPSIETRWGLLETLGQVPPEDLDISFTADYFGKRGPAGGIDADYGGGFISETTRRAWNFEGELRSYFVYDHGSDDLGSRRAVVEPPQEFRGRAAWQHQHFFPEDWQLQARAAWVSDPTFLEEWFERDFNDELPLETSLYLKKQRDTEAVTFLATLQPNGFVTSADLLQEQFEIQRMPELGYHRIGDSFANDKLTFYSTNTVSLLAFETSSATLVEQGFRPGRQVVPGLPSLGVVGATGPPPVDDDTNFRGDFRQEVDFPFALGQFKVVPYVFGRYTGYQHAIDGERADRAYAGTGVRINTQFWKIDNTARSELFDVYRVRHVVQPEVHLFTSATNVNPNELFIYDEPIDKTYDVSAVQLALRQRWQTKRGGPGRLRSVDFLTLNLEANLYANQPAEQELIPVGFRGLFFGTLPEASIPRNAINAYGEWRMSDTTIVLADAQYNIDETRLATTSGGIIARRDARLSYFVGLRYIEDLDSAIGTVAASYDLTRKYSFGFRQSYNFREEGGVYSSVSIQRRFDRFFMMFTVYDDRNAGEQGFGFALYPEGIAGASSEQLTRLFGGAGN